jgi:N-acetylneuraminate synthase
MVQIFHVLWITLALSQLIEGSNIIFKSRGDYKGPVSEEEKTIAFAFASIVAIEDIAAGETLTEKNIWVKRPGNEILVQMITKIF